MKLSVLFLVFFSITALAGNDVIPAGRDGNWEYCPSINWHLANGLCYRLPQEKMPAQRDGNYYVCPNVNYHVGSDGYCYFRL